MEVEVGRSDDVEILERGVNSHNKRLFLESFYSCKDVTSVNEHKHFPRVSFHCYKEQK